MFEVLMKMIDSDIVCMIVDLNFFGILNFNISSKIEFIIIVVVFIMVLRFIIDVFFFLIKIF